MFSVVVAASVTAPGVVTVVLLATLAVVALSMKARPAPMPRPTLEPAPWAEVCTEAASPIA